MAGFVHFSNFLIPSEKYYNSQSFLGEKTNKIHLSVHFFLSTFRIQRVSVLRHFLNDDGSGPPLNLTFPLLQCRNVQQNVT